jgi:hypothetical protein
MEEGGHLLRKGQRGDIIIATRCESGTAAIDSSRGCWRASPKRKGPMGSPWRTLVVERLAGAPSSLPASQSLKGQL